MRLSQIQRVILLSLLVVPLVVAGIFLMRASDPGTAQERQGFRIGATPEAPFNGTLLGVRFGPSEALVRDGVRESFRVRCPAGTFDVRDGTEFLPPPPSYIPEGAIQAIPPVFLDVPNAPNPVALVCPSTGEVLRAALSYTIPLVNDAPGELHILRDFDPTPGFSTTVPASRIKIVRLGGRDAVLIDASIPGRLGIPGTPSFAVVFPEPQGYLAVTAQGIAAEEFFKVVASLRMEDRQ